uniref:hypothetical protein n=1 Tax=Candidatus Cryptobacteroides bacterium TaxID=3085639 RepID=UPI004029C6BB
MIVQGYRNPDVSVHYLVKRDARLYQAVAQVHWVGDVFREFRGFRGRWGHLRSLQLRDLGESRRSGEK